MNRKLLNGLLVLAVAAGGVGTFTSCKDEDFRNQVLVNQQMLQAQIDALRNLTDADFVANIDKWFETKSQPLWDQLNALGVDVNQLKSDVAGLKTDINNLQDYDAYLKGLIDALEDRIKDLEGKDLPEITDLTDKVEALELIWKYIKDGNYSEVQDYVNGLYKMMFENVFPEEDWFQQIFNNERLINNLIKRVSSVGINQTINPVFGSINLPIGLKTTVLAAYKYQGTSSAEYKFPTQVRDVEAGQNHLALDFDQNPENIQALTTIASLAKGKEISLYNGSYTMGAGFGQMGAAYININPSSLDFENSRNVQLVNSKDEVLLDAAEGDLVVENNSEVLSFGYTRGEQTGVYKVNANVCDKFEENGGVVIDMDNLKEYVGDVKAAIKDKTISNIAFVGEQLYKRINNLLPAYSFKVWWNEKDANGNSVKNSVRSTYDVAAAVIHPLSYGTPLSEAFNGTIGDRRLPQFSPLRTYLEKIGNKLHVEYKVGSIDNVEFDFTVKVEDGKVIFTYPGPDGNDITGEAYYDQFGIQVDYAKVTEFVNAILEALNYELAGSINEQIVKQINDQLADINAQLDKFNAKVGDFLQYIENSRYYDYASKLVDIYNTFAQKVNNVLSNPDHYLQVAAIYSDGEGHYHHLSTDANDPVRVFPKDGADAIEILATSYTGDVVVPSYAKYVAITAVNGKPATIADNTKAGSSLNTVLPGQVNRVPVKLSGFNKGDVLTLTYVSVDYHGLCSMQNYYVVVK